MITERYNSPISISKLISRLLVVTVIALAFLLVNHGVAQSSAAIKNTIRNAIPAWRVVNEQQFRPGYYYWPAYGQKPSDARYCATWDALNQMNIEVTGKPKASYSPSKSRKSAVPPAGRKVVPAYPNQVPPRPSPPGPRAIHRPAFSIVPFIIIYLPIILLVLFVAKKVFSSFSPQKKPPPLGRSSNNRKNPSTGNTVEFVGQSAPADMEMLDNFLVASAESSDGRTFNARVTLNDHSLVISPVENPTGEKLSWQIPLTNIVQAQINYGSAPSPRIIIVSKASVCGPVSHGRQYEKVFIVKTDWFKRHEADIKRGRIHPVEQRSVSVKISAQEYSRRVRSTGAYYYLRPEGEFFDPYSHCFCCYLDGKGKQFTDDFISRLFAMRKKLVPPIPGEIPTNEDLLWQCKPAPEGFRGLLKRGLLGFAGAAANSQGVRSPAGILPKQFSMLNIYLTKGLLILEVFGDNETEIAMFPDDGVRSVQWGADSKHVTLEIFVDGPWTPYNSFTPQQQRPSGTGPSLNLPTSHLAQTGGWDQSFLTGQNGRRFVVIDPDSLKDGTLESTLNERFNRPRSPNIPPPLPK